MTIVVEQNDDHKLEKKSIDEYDFEDDPIIYAQIQREPDGESKLVKFLDTIPRFQSKLTQISSLQNQRKIVRIAYNLESRSTNQPKLKVPQNNQNENNSPSSSSAIKLIPFDHIFSGSLPEKLRSIPATLLTKPIESFASGRLNNAVIIAIDDFIDQCCPLSSPTSAGYLDINDQQKSNLINEFRQFVHRGLMMHSIAWMFDAINNRVDDECLNESNVNPKLSHCHSGINHNSAYIQLSASALFHHKIYDLIANNRSSSPSQSTLVAVDHEIEYECVNARQAANHLERALAFLEQIHLNHPNGQRNEHLFVFTIHLYRYQFVPLANSRKKCQDMTHKQKKLDKWATRTKTLIRRRLRHHYD
ncbi:hypothetical protein DERF_009924 [Dermatophagoides farinae]|uniref:Uncharacterized protein n=1 Tax=Dermatophagoides farinae TaxID=6954 RepID=A0A922L307_DERFA|nr:hypothetical protein DERF_009924 [Dermatophagoides farinae]